MTSEARIQSEILRSLGGRRDVRLFRNQVGACQTADGRWLRYGLAPGSADLVGWQSVRVKPWMVGQSLAVFLSLEIKRADGIIAPGQKAWLDAIESAGGRAGIVRSVGDADAVLIL